MPRLLGVEFVFICKLKALPKNMHLSISTLQYVELLLYFFPESHNIFICLKFRLLHAFCILGNGEGIDHRLDVASEEALQVVSRVADTMVGHAALWEVVGTDLR